MPINQRVIVNERETTQERQVQSIEDKNPRKSNITQNPVEELKYALSWLNFLLNLLKLQLCYGNHAATKGRRYRKLR